jgi:benzoate-CoA ligase
MNAHDEPIDRFNIAQYLFDQNIARPNKAAFIDDAGQLTFAQLEKRSQQVGRALSTASIRPEERVLVLMHDTIDWPVTFLGTIHVGVVPVAVNTLLTPEDYAYMLTHSRAQAVFVSAALLPVLQSAIEKIQATQRCTLKAIFVSGVTAMNTCLGIAVQSLTSLWSEADSSAHSNAQAPADAMDVVLTHKDDPAFWLYSSGSTGRPKGTVHTHANVYWTCKLYAQDVLGLNESDVCFSAAKLFFAYGLGNALSFPLSVGATTVLMAERPTPDAVFKRWRGQVAGATDVCKPTIFYGAPTGFAGMLAAPNLPSRHEVALRFASSAGEALPAELGQKFKAHFGIDIVDGIGSTEMLHIYLSNLPGKVHYGTTGFPVPGYEVQLRGDDGQLVADGEPGDLYVKGPSAALMYWSNRVKSRETFQGEWTKSGDKYVRNENGTYTYSGRGDDMLKVSGIYVSPFEVESTLMQHDAVLEAAVIGVLDAEGLTKTKAYIVLKEGQTTDEATLKAFVKDRLAPFKYPRLIEFVSELPKTATGKIQRFKLRALNG